MRLRNLGKAGDDAVDVAGGGVGNRLNGPFGFADGGDGNVNA